MGSLAAQVRIFYMHRFGGMYADLDVEALRDLSPLLLESTQPVLAYLSDTWDLRHNIPNAWMASPAGHPFWQVRRCTASEALSPISPSPRIPIDA